jgi:hypothetical protein
MRVRKAPVFFFCGEVEIRFHGRQLSHRRHMIAYGRWNVKGCSAVGAILKHKDRSCPDGEDRKEPEVRAPRGARLSLECSGGRGSWGSELRGVERTQRSRGGTGSHGIGKK